MQGLDRITAAARAAGLPMASHDDDSIATREQYRERGARICEFPMAEAVGRAAADAGDFVAMGCPNVVRGGSHLGWASAARLVEAGICSVLTSDYYYPAMMRGGVRPGRTRGVGSGGGVAADCGESRPERRGWRIAAQSRRGNGRTWCWPIP